MGFPQHGVFVPQDQGPSFGPLPNDRGIASAAVPAQASAGVPAQAIAASKGPWWHGGRFAGFLSTILDGIYQER